MNKDFSAKTSKVAKVPRSRKYGRKCREQSVGQGVLTDLPISHSKWTDEVMGIVAASIKEIVS